MVTVSLFSTVIVVASLPFASTNTPLVMVISAGALIPVIVKSSVISVLTSNSVWSAIVTVSGAVSFSITVTVLVSSVAALPAESDTL